MIDASIYDLTLIIALDACWSDHDNLDGTDYRPVLPRQVSGLIRLGGESSVAFSRPRRSYIRMGRASDG